MRTDIAAYTAITPYFFQTQKRRKGGKKKEKVKKVNRRGLREDSLSL